MEPPICEGLWCTGQPNERRWGGVVLPCEIGALGTDAPAANVRRQQYARLYRLPVRVFSSLAVNLTIRPTLPSGGEGGGGGRSSGGHSRAPMSLNCDKLPAKRCLPHAACHTLPATQPTLSQKARLFGDVVGVAAMKRGLWCGSHVLFRG